jgi:hypothetical protein
VAPAEEKDDGIPEVFISDEAGDEILSEPYDVQ